MVETRRQVRNKSRTPYQHPQIETNGQKRQKTDKEQQKQIASTTITESHVTQTRDVDHNNNTHQTNRQPTSTEDTTVNIDLIDETLSDADDWNEISFTARHKIYIAAEQAQGETKWEKRKFFEDFFTTNIRIIGTSIKRENEQTFIKIDFSTETAKDLAAKHLLEKNIPCKGSINNTSNNIIDRKNEIIVRDIPIDYTENDVKRQFLIYGNITKVILKVSGAWKQAHVFFEDAKTVEDNFINNWSDFIGKDGVRIFLANDYESNINLRGQFCGKLCNLPKNTTAYDLEGYIRSINGKTCFVPRARRTYNRLRYAYVNFESQEDLEKVLNDTTPSYIKNFQIHWVEPDTKTCHIC